MILIEFINVFKSKKNSSFQESEKNELLFSFHGIGKNKSSDFFEFPINFEFTMNNDGIIKKQNGIKKMFEIYSSVLITEINEMDT